MRYISPSLHESILHRGKSLEQFLGAGPCCSEPQISWIELRPVLQGIEVWHFIVPDSGSLQFADIYDWGNDDTEPVAILRYACDALALAHSTLGANPEYWVNTMMAGDEYLDYVAAGRMPDWRRGSKRIRNDKSTSL